MLLKYLLGCVAESGEGEDLEVGMGGKLLEVAGDFLAEEDDAALVRGCGDAIEELLVWAVCGIVAACELLAPENFLEVVEDDQAGLVGELVDEIVEALGKVDGWGEEAAEVGGDVAIEEFGEGAVALEALPDDVFLLVLFDELAGKGGFAGAAGGVD